MPGPSLWLVGPWPTLATPWRRHWFTLVHVYTLPKIELIDVETRSGRRELPSYSDVTGNNYVRPRHPTWTAQKPLGPSQRSHSSAMLLHFQLKRCTITVLPSWQIGVLNCANAPVGHADVDGICNFHYSALSKRLFHVTIKLQCNVNG